ncbi:MAG: hypothetical protein P8L23_01710 [Flavobacteriales bacterium]|nr:hypothetical protein [Flavobacteriales bacterium]
MMFEDEIKACEIEYLKFEKYNKNIINHYIKYELYKEEFPVLNANYLRQYIKEYHLNFELNCIDSSNKSNFEEWFHKLFLERFINKIQLNPITQEFDDYKELLNELRTGELWKKEKTPLFHTVSNRDFFNYVMQFFKNDRVMYNQRTLSYVYWRMESVFYGQNGLYIRYVNENYKDLKPLKKVLSRSVIQSQYILEQRNVLFNKAMKSWNEKNQCFQKNFEPLYLLIK